MTIELNGRSLSPMESTPAQNLEELQVQLDGAFLMEA